ncbi:hypothetical protein E4U09_006031 [Claviceps aff. purpurea]|uniref:Uncharacterized protein n=1 Tax=Claviceps aff. purpurea TaxID=1967640 RepID=A0A9P7QKR2_9HYPO|nr:hypothetical protein E4U09_006031 [Claviceps aff. purpurea]
MVFYGNAPVDTPPRPPPGASPGPLMVTPNGTRAETGSATDTDTRIWRRTLEISFTQRPTLSEFADSLPRLATWAGVGNINRGGCTWRSASVYVLYANSKGGVAIRAGTGPVSNENVLRVLRVAKAGAAEAGETDGDATTQEEWDAEMGRWEGGQVELHVVVCMEGGEDA